MAEDERRVYGNRVWSAREGYDLAAPYYDQWYWKTFWERNERPEIERLLRDVPRETFALDIGCGTGTYCQVLEQRSSTIGVDPSLGMLRVAKGRKLLRTYVACARASALPLREGIVDVAIAARSLCHEPRLLTALLQIAHVMRPGGQLVISDVHAQHDYPRTRIPFGHENQDIHIDTIKRAPRDVEIAAEETKRWVVSHEREYRWRDLQWAPEDDRFFRLDRASERPIFFIIAMARR
jgi:SAM-dependent methyltransferase